MVKPIYQLFPYPFRFSKGRQNVRYSKHLVGNFLNFFDLTNQTKISQTLTKELC